MSFFCWFRHSWRYHGLPPERRTCVRCLLRQHLVTMGSLEAWVPTKKGNT